MSCCGKNRQALKSERISATTNVRSATTMTRVSFQGEYAVMLRGPHTGSSYLFTPERRELDVDSRDLAAILATGLFRAG